MTCFAEGDKNTSLFNNHVNGKRKFLRLSLIQDEDGNWIESLEDI